jgi:hypothetical protein
MEVSHRNSSERACSSTKSSAPEFYRKTTGYLGGVILPKQPFGDGEYGGGWFDAGDHVKFGLPLTCIPHLV